MENKTEFKIKSLILLKIIKKIIKITLVNSNNNKTPCFLLQVEQKKIILTAWNDYLSLKYELYENENKLKIFKTGSLFINSKILYDIFSKLEDEWILFKFELHNLFISNLKTDNNDFIFKLTTLEIANIPKLDFNSEEINKFSLQKNLLQKIIEQIAFATVLNNNINPTFSGINFNFQKEELIITATDSTCIARKRVPYLNLKKPKIINKQFNIPVAIISEIEKITNDLNNKEINFYFETNYKLIIKIENFLFQTRMIEGKFPETNDVIARFLTNEKNLINISNVKDFLNVIELSIILAKKDSVPMIGFLINTKLNEFKINCLSNNDTIGQVIEQFKKFKIVTKNNTGEIKVAFNSKLIINALKSFNKCKQVTLKFLQPKNFLIIESEEETGLLQLVLPVG